MAVTLRLRESFILVMSREFLSWITPSKAQMYDCTLEGREVLIKSVLVSPHLNYQ